MSGRELKLNLFIYPEGHHEAAWALPGFCGGQVGRQGATRHLR